MNNNIIFDISTLIIENGLDNYTDIVKNILESYVELGNIQEFNNMSILIEILSLYDIKDSDLNNIIFRATKLNISYLLSNFDKKNQIYSTLSKSLFE